MRPVEFGVHGATDRSDGHVEVVGRCYRGWLGLATVFTERHPADGAADPVLLEVVRIEAYGHLLESLDEGMTARLVLAGDGSRPTVGSVLRATGTGTDR